MAQPQLSSIFLQYLARFTPPGGAPNGAAVNGVTTGSAQLPSLSEVSKELGDEFRPGYMLPIIHRNTTIPISRVHRVQTTHPNQTNSLGCSCSRNYSQVWHSIRSYPGVGKNRLDRHPASFSPAFHLVWTTFPG